MHAEFRNMFEQNIVKHSCATYGNFNDVDLLNEKYEERMGS